MRCVLDTNVFVSGVFFAGPPARILEAWRDGKIKLVVSAAVLDEYQRVGRLLASRYEGVDLEPILTLALASGVSVVVSGDNHLRRVSGWSGIQVLSPRQFVDRFLPDPAQSYR